MLETLAEFLLPSWVEVQVSVVAAALVVVALWFFTVDEGANDRTVVDSTATAANVNDESEEVLSITLIPALFVFHFLIFKFTPFRLCVVW